MTNKFLKPAYSIEQSIQLLLSRQLKIINHKQARHYLTYIGYYRLMGYGRFYYQHPQAIEPQFIPDTEFTDLIALYNFDRELRILILDAIERIEVAARTVISNYMCTNYNNPHWFLDRAIMFSKIKLSGKNRIKPKLTSLDDLINRIKEDTQYSNKGGSNPIYKNYYNNYPAGPELPASWMLTEGLSMGTWSFIYSFIRSNRDQKTIARHFKLNAELFHSWFLALTFLRNLAAHHSLVCYRHYHISPESPRRINPVFKNDFDYGSQKLYSFLLVIEYINKIIAPNSTWAQRLIGLIKKTNKLDLNKIGFPQGWEKNWQQNSFWQSEIKIA
jgi:abortive infection bacteriophage resistance protein